MEKGTNGDKRGQRGQILSPFLSPLKRRCIGTNRIFSNLGSMEGDKKGTKKGQKWGQKPQSGGFWFARCNGRTGGTAEILSPFELSDNLVSSDVSEQTFLSPFSSILYIFIFFFFDFSIYRYTEWGQNLSPFSVSSDVSPEPICPLCPLNVLKCSPFFPLYRGKGGGGQNFGFCPLFVPFVPLTC